VLKNRPAWGIALALLLLALGGAAWYVIVPLKHQRWEQWHERNFGQVRAALAGQSYKDIERAPDMALQPIVPHYQIALKKAVLAHQARHRLQDQSRRTVKVVRVTVQVLAAGNDIGLDALREPLKQAIDEQHWARTEIYWTDQTFKDIKQQLRIDWRKLWPDNKLDFKLEFPVMSMSAEELKQANAILADLTALEKSNLEKYGEIVQRRVPAKVGKGSNLTPYEEDKYELAVARRTLYDKLHVALEDAYEALGRPAEQSHAALARKAVVDMEAQSEQIQQMIDEAGK
jgi:hypothetical protein